MNYLSDERESLQRNPSSNAWKRIGDIGYAVQSHVEPYGYGVVREFVGHGIGREDARRANGP